jgi:hypothetical protein
MMKIRRKIYGVLLTFCLIMGILPVTVFASGEGNGKAIQFGTGGISGYSDTEGYDYIYFGTWENAPVKWKVLDDQTNTGTDGLFLVSEKALTERIKFDNDDISNAWQGSDAQLWCKDFYYQSMTAIEQTAVLPTTKSDVAFDGFAASTNILDNDRVFFLSAEELENSGYGFVDRDSKRAQYNGENVSYWLRSPHNSENVSGNWVGIFWDTLGFVTNGVGENAARPALNLDTATVLFTSVAAGGKASSTAGILSAVSDYTGNEWKLTLQDNNRRFTANVNGQTSVSVSSAGGSVQITYSGAQTGDNEYVSAFLCDHGGNVLYYGNIAQNSADGTATLNIPSGITAGSYTLKIFSEQCNGDYKTDHASAFQDISLTVLPQEATPQASFTATGDNGGTLSNIEPGMKYSTNGGTSWKDITGTTMELTDVTAVNDVKVYKPGNGTTTADSDVQTIDITQAEKPTVNSVDCTTTAQNDGKITDTDSTMEYKLSAASEWTGITGTEVTGLSNGAYDVRVKANGTVLASDAATVTIGEHTCAAQGEWQYDANGHWKLCSCGTEVDRAAHSGGTATCTDPAVCEVCEQSYGSVNPDEHTGEIVWTKTATAHSSAYSCCDTPVVKEEAHEWENGVCLECGYECQHKGGTATCTDKAVCEICGEEYREVNDSNHTNLVKTAAKPATHMTEGNIEYWYCDDCDKYFRDETGTQEITLEDTVIPKLTEHTADGTGWHSDETKHWNTCECGEILDKAEHNFKWITDKEATATEAGSKHEECTVCGYEKAAVKIPATGTAEKPSEPLQPDEKPGNTTSPGTGDPSSTSLWFAVMVAAGTVLTGAVLCIRRRNCSREAE